MNLATKSLAGLRQQPRGFVVLLQHTAAPEHRDPVGQLIASSMSCVTNTMVFCNSLCRLSISSCSSFADHRVDRGERLVHQQDRRVGGQCPCHADALLLSTG